jgi:hypothetical protein
MLLREFFESSLDEKRIWARSGGKIVRKYRCSSGSKKGRIVAKPSVCYSPPNLKQRYVLAKTKARLGARIARKAKRTKRMNPASIRVQRLNKASGRR